MRKLAFGLIFLVTSLGLVAQEGFPRLLPAEVNSGYEEWGPVASPEGRALYFTRLGHPQNMGEISGSLIGMPTGNGHGQSMSVLL